MKEEKSPFIIGNTKGVTLDELSNDYLVPVFSRDNEETISHSDFIIAMQQAASDFFGCGIPSEDIRVSHEMKMRNLSGMGKKKSELTDDDFGSYMQRMAFIAEIPGYDVSIHGCEHKLQICGVRAYNETNLLGGLSKQKFRIAVGYVNMICTNLCVSVEGSRMDVHCDTTEGLYDEAKKLFSSYDMQQHAKQMEQLSDVMLTEEDVAYFIGKARLYNNMSSSMRNGLPEFLISDTQMNAFTRDYLMSDFGRDSNNLIDGWKLYQLLTNFKNNYIDTFLERNVNAFTVASGICDYMIDGSGEWGYFTRY